VLKILQEWCVFCDADVLVIDVLDKRVASSEYRYSAGNAMGIAAGLQSVAKHVEFSHRGK
jgi:hypothetical protein